MSKISITAMITDKNGFVKLFPGIADLFPVLFRYFCKEKFFYLCRVYIYPFFVR